MTSGPPTSLPQNQTALSPKEPSALPEHLLVVDNLSVQLGRTLVLKSLSLPLSSGETFVILGESGCGKTTLLKALSGLIPVLEGDIRLRGQSILAQTPQQRGILYLDQEPLLFEHLNVRENLAFALRLRRIPDAEIEMAVDGMLQDIDLVEHRHKYEWQLSGGQKQRVTFARAVLARPSLLLLDEPFSSLDSVTRQQMQALFARICHQQALTAIFVTHDVKEALILGERFARMSAGQLHIYRSRQDFMDDPATGVSREIAFWKSMAAPSQPQLP